MPAKIPPAEKPSWNTHVANVFAFFAGAHSLMQVSASGVTMPSAVPMMRRKIANPSGPCTTVASRPLEIVSIHSASSMTRRRPNRSDSRPCSTEPIDRPMMPLESMKPIMPGEGCQVLRTSGMT